MIGWIYDHISEWLNVYLSVYQLYPVFKETSPNKTYYHNGPGLVRCVNRFCDLMRQWLFSRIDNWLNG